ncbi:MAG: TIGR00725 family protein, partial [Deltaproteobacteria bacterium]|nr:TIGR00725 family protein [Deltaproteobacteria bacterium]
MNIARSSVAIVGAGDATPAVCDLAYAAGLAVARRGAVLICGGRGGVMAAAARGAQSAGGLTVGILPGYDRREANANIEIAIATGMGEARNAIVVASADSVVALEGEGGTLSEIGFAIKLGRPVVGLRAWQQLEMISHADDPIAAIDLALELAKRQKKARKPE